MTISREPWPLLAGQRIPRSPFTRASRDPWGSPDKRRIRAARAFHCERDISFCNVSLPRWRCGEVGRADRDAGVAEGTCGERFVVD
jgi:hypothetical protein